MGIQIKIHESQMGIQNGSHVGPSAKYRGPSEFVSSNDKMLAPALRDMAQGLGAVGDALYARQQKKMELDLITDVKEHQANSQRFIDDYQMNYQGRDGVDAEGAYLAWNQQQAEALKKKYEGNTNAQIYLAQHAGAIGLSGTNTMRDYGNKQMEVWENSVRAGEMSDIFMNLDEAPTSFLEQEARGLATIRAANPGLDTTAKENEFRQNLANKGIEAAIAQGDVSTAQAIVSRAGSSAEKAELQKTFAAAESKARIDFGIRAGTKAVEEGRSLEFQEDVLKAITTGELSAEEGQKISQGVKSLEETGRQARKARRDEQEEAAKNEYIQAEANGTFDLNQFRDDTRLSADYRERRIKEKTSDRKPSLDSVNGRDIDMGIRTAIDMGEISDLDALYARVNAQDPDGQYISAETLSKYEKRIQDAQKVDADGNPKHNYFNEAMQVVGKRQEFSAINRSADAKAKGALQLMKLRSALLREMDMNGISVDDQAAGKMVLDAVDKKVVTSPGRVWDTTERWFNMPPESRPPLYNRPAPAPSAGGGGGAVLSGSMGTAGVLAQKAMEMVAKGGSHWLPEYEENNAALGLTEAAEEQAVQQGLPVTPFTTKWATQGMLEQRPIREVTPSFAAAWPGQGKVAVNNLGKVHDYNDLIERYATSYGIDPNLIAAMMYTESRGNRFAVSHAGAKGLMQFMPATAERFGITDRTDPSQSIRGACQYMRWLLDRYDGNVAKAVGGYNAGEGNIDKGRYPTETKNYISRVMSTWQSAGQGQTSGQMLAGPQGQPTQGAGGFVSPLSNMLVTSKYGPRNTGIVGASRNHLGIDLRAPIGTPVGSIADGVVEAATYKGKNGNYVVVNHGEGRKSYYLHLDGFTNGLKPGARIKAGQIIGRSGNSGSFKKPLAPHLDFRISENGQFVDPAKYFPNLKHKGGA